MNQNCVLCGNPITLQDNSVLFGMDGDFVHKNCYRNKEKHFISLDNMTDEQFVDWITGGNKYA